jgi:hypothetical protein
MQFPALPSNDAFTSRGTPLRQKDMEKSHLCRETREIYVPCDQVAHANPDVDLSHPRPCARGEAETPTREKKTGVEGFNLP